MAFKIKVPDQLINNIYTYASNPTTAELAWEAVNMQIRGKGELVGDYWEFTDPRGVLARDMVLSTFIGTTQLGVIVEDLGLWLEMPKSDFENNEVFVGLSSRTYLDENEVEQTHAWKSWATNEQYTFKENLAGDRVVFAAKPTGFTRYLSNMEFLPIYSAEDAGADIVIHTASTYKTNILENELWVSLEEV